MTHCGDAFAPPSGLEDRAERIAECKRLKTSKRNPVKSLLQQGFKWDLTDNLIFFLYHAGN